MSFSRNTITRTNYNPLEHHNRVATGNSLPQTFEMQMNYRLQQLRLTGEGRVKHFSQATSDINNSNSTDNNNNKDSWLIRDFQTKDVF